MPIFALDNDSMFPDPRLAEADGMLALGATLEPERILLAYSLGIFPWPIPRLPLAWFSPDPRMLLYFENLRISRSLKKRLRARELRVTMDTAFGDVVRACASVPRPGQGGNGTWITRDVVRAYSNLHSLGFAHSVEVWHGETLVGGLYGISLGKMFCGESMFHRATDASKIAFVCLAKQLERWDFAFLDCQLETPHLRSLGAAPVSRAEFLKQLERATASPNLSGPWKLELTPAEIAANAAESALDPSSEQDTARSAE